MVKILIGSDPELFVTDDKGIFVSGHNLIPGTKEEPFPVVGGAIQVDGVATEFNVEPSDTSDMFMKNIRNVMNSLEDYIKAINPDYNLSITPTAHFEKSYFESLPEETRKLGCTPDYSAYTGEEQQPPETTEPFRTGAGHIHIGWTQHEMPFDPEHMQKCCELVKELDATLYANSLLWDADNKRRTLYGKMGSFRPKSYGVEYRPLSNAYLRDSKVQKFVFDMTMNVADRFFNKEESSIHRKYVPAKFIEDVLLDKTISQKGVEAYTQHIGDEYGLPVFRW